VDQAFAAIWNVLGADDPFRDYANDSELRLAIGRKLLNLVADGVIDPSRLRYLTIKSTQGGQRASPPAPDQLCGRAFGKKSCCPSIL
jgi:hypothetical protein